MTSSKFFGLPLYLSVIHDGSIDGLGATGCTIWIPDFAPCRFCTSADFAPLDGADFAPFITRNTFERWGPELREMESSPIWTSSRTAYWVARSLSRLFLAKVGMLG